MNNKDFLAATLLPDARGDVVMRSNAGQVTLNGMCLKQNKCIQGRLDWFSLTLQQRGPCLQVAQYPFVDEMEKQFHSTSFSTTSLTIAAFTSIQSATTVSRGGHFLFYPKV